MVEDDIMKDMTSLKALSEKQLNDLVSMSLEFLTSTDGTQNICVWRAARAHLVTFALTQNFPPDAPNKE